VSSIAVDKGMLEIKCVVFVGELSYGHLRKKPRE